MIDEQLLRGQRALVTGANSGIGEGIARALGAGGAAIPAPALPSIESDRADVLSVGEHVEQRRLFYVSITRAKRTLVVSRARSVGRGAAKQFGLTVTTGGKY